MKFGLIGYGRFGRFAARHLSKYGSVSVYDPQSRTRRAEKGMRNVPLAVAASQEIVILAVPVRTLRAVLTEIRSHLRPGALLCDVCAVKSGPVRWMCRMAPENVSVLGAHPLFGPDSAARSVRGRTIVLCPGRIAATRLHRIRRSLEGLGLRTEIMTPARHDTLMAETIFLTQAVGRLVHGAGLRRQPRVTQNYDHLLRIVDTVRNDTDELFADMARHSAESRRVVRLLDRSFQRMKKVVRQRIR